MGNKSSQVKTISQVDVQSLLEIYTPICETLDQQLGKLKIYRKKQFNFDYISLTEKVMTKQMIQDCKHLLKLGKKQYLKGKKRGKSSHFESSIITDAQLWLRIFSFQILNSQSNNEGLEHLKICIQYLNFSLKEYIYQYATNLQCADINLLNKNKKQNEIPKSIGYILGCVLDAYIQLRELHQSQSCLNILSMITAITNPNLIYVNLDGCLKFLPIPLFIFNDYFTQMDKCMIHCCKFANQETDINGRNIVIPKYGNTVTNPHQCCDKLDRVFITKFKKLIKHIRNQMSLSLINKGNNDSLEEVTTHFGSQQTRGHLRIQSNRSNISAKLKSQLSFWDSIESLSTVEQLVNKIKNIQKLPQYLQFGQNLEEGNGKKQEKQKIRLQKYNKNKNQLSISNHLNGSLNKSSGFQSNDNLTSNVVKPQNKNDQFYLNSFGRANQYENNLNIKNVSVNMGVRTNESGNNRFNYNRGSERYKIGGKEYATPGMTSKHTSSQNSNIWNYRMGAPLL